MYFILQANRSMVVAVAIVVVLQLEPITSELVIFFPNMLYENFMSACEAKP